MARASLAVEEVEAEGAIRVGRAAGAAKAAWPAEATVQAAHVRAAVAVGQESRRGSSQGGCTARGQWQQQRL